MVSKNHVVSPQVISKLILLISFPHDKNLNSENPTMFISAYRKERKRTIVPIPQAIILCILRFGDTINISGLDKGIIDYIYDDGVCHFFGRNYCFLMTIILYIIYSRCFVFDLFWFLPISYIAKSFTIFLQ